MPKVKLSGGEGYVSVSHGFAARIDFSGYTAYEWFQSWRDSSGNIRQSDTHRATRVVVELADKTRLETLAVCQPEDPFNRRTGRSIAGRKMNAMLRHYQVSKEDRQQIMAVVFHQKTQ